MPLSSIEHPPWIAGLRPPEAYRWEEMAFTITLKGLAGLFKLFLTEEGYSGLIDWLDDLADRDLAAANPVQAWLADNAIVAQNPGGPSVRVHDEIVAWAKQPGRW